MFVDNVKYFQLSSFFYPSESSIFSDKRLAAECYHLSRDELPADKHALFCTTGSLIIIHILGNAKSTYLLDKLLGCIHLADSMNLQCRKANCWRIFTIFIFYQTNMYIYWKENVSFKLSTFISYYIKKKMLGSN